MANEYQETADRLTQKTRQIAERFRAAQQENKQLAENLQHTQSQLKQAHDTILDLQKQLSHARTAGALATSDAERQAAKERLTRMAREIDKCLALLAV